MRVAIVANSCWNIYKFRLNLVKKLIEEDCEVFVLAPLDEYIHYLREFPSVRHIALKNLHRKGTNPLNDIALTFELKRIYTEVSPDIIVHYTHKPNIFGGMAAALSGKKSIAVVTGLGFSFIHKGVVNIITRRLYAFTSRFHKKFVFENSDDMALFIEMKLVKPGQALTIMGCGVDIDYYAPRGTGESEDQKDRVFVFSFIGRLLYDKGITEFVHAARLIRDKHPEIEFRIIGELDTGNPSMIRKEDLLEWRDSGTVKYFGFIDDVRPLIAGSSAIIVPSYREGLSRVIMEAMAMGKPVIASDTPGCRQVVDDGFNGFLVKVGDAEAIKSALIRFINMNSKEREIMGLNGRKMAETSFASEKIASELYEIISQTYFSG